LTRAFIDDVPNSSKLRHGERSEAIQPRRDAPLRSEDRIYQASLLLRSQEIATRAAASASSMLA
jgi:hypothetical protein